MQENYQMSSRKESNLLATHHLFSVWISESHALHMNPSAACISFESVWLDRKAHVQMCWNEVDRSKLRPKATSFSALHDVPELNFNKGWVHAAHQNSAHCRANPRWRTIIYWTPRFHLNLISQRAIRAKFLVQVVWHNIKEPGTRICIYIYCDGREHRTMDFTTNEAKTHSIYDSLLWARTV